jgi:hypothetical protein
MVEYQTNNLAQLQGCYTKANWSEDFRKACHTLLVNKSSASTWA